jgi:hypothetical protein
MSFIVFKIRYTGIFFSYRVLKTHSEDVKRAVRPYHLLSITIPDHEENNYIRKKQTHSHINMSGLELATIGLGCIVFIGAVTSAFCIICLHRRR